MTRSHDRGGRSQAVLLIAFHFPPFGTSSGVHRTVSLARHLQEYGWQPVILTAHTRAYGESGPAPVEALPDRLPIKRAQALDTAKHLAIKGHYPRMLALPDRWVSWLAGAIPSGLQLIRRHRPAVIWSTYPIATAHMIGWTLHRLTGLPWIADFRDPMVELIDGTWYPPDVAMRKSRLSVERRVAADASATSFCTATSRSIFVERHDWTHRHDDSVVIENGFDPLEFSAAEKLPSQRDTSRLHLVHSGTLYPGPDRDPSAMLIAIAHLRGQGLLPARLRVTLRATGFDDNYRPTIERLGLADIVALAPSLAYREALREILDADGLLIFQGHTSNPAIPAKVYEYLRAARPILAMVDGNGETARLLRRANVGMLVQTHDSGLIQSTMSRFLAGIQEGTHKVLDPDEIARFSRTHRVKEFAELMNAVAVQARGGR